MDPGSILLLAALVAGLGWGTLWYLRRMARQALNPRFSWQPLDPARGESLDITVDVEASQVVVVRTVEAHLIATRYAYPPPDSQSGGLWLMDGERPMGTPEKDICSHCRVALCHDMMFNPGDPMKLVGQLDVPSDALPTHTNGRLQIHWSLQIRFDIANFPAPLVLERSIEVRREPSHRPTNYRPPEPIPASVAPLLGEPTTPPPYVPRPPLAPPPVHAPQSGLELDAPAKPLPAATPATPGRWPWTEPAKAPAEAPPNGSVFLHLEIDTDKTE